ncbi:hypothetical protein SHKM778_79310 [Streptomyces sp. KM77-8]|uniref:Uncharacterized protein n=1 Tax=Streptomyces haneummycinicus TaxID=3074435 RepID=A0AAT9HW99_9ACTN
MVVDAGRAAHRLRGVFGADGVDAVVAHALAHQRDQVGPEGVPFGRCDVAAGAVEVDAVPEEDLGAVDVAHAGDDLLVHEERGDRRTAAADPAVGGGPVGARAERVGAEAVVDRPFLAVRDQGAGGGAAQIDVRQVAGEAEPDGVRGRWRGGRAEGDLAEEAEVDVDPLGRFGGAEAEEEVLSVGVGGVQRCAVEEGGGVGELALGAGDAEGVPAGKAAA